MEGSILTQKVTYSTRKRILYMYMLYNFAILSRMNRIDGHVVRKSACMLKELQLNSAARSTDLDCSKVTWANYSGPFNTIGK